MPGEAGFKAQDGVERQHATPAAVSRQAGRSQDYKKDYNTNKITSKTTFYERTS